KKIRHLLKSTIGNTIRDDLWKSVQNLHLFESIIKIFNRYMTNQSTDTFLRQNRIMNLNPDAITVIYFFYSKTVLANKQRSFCVFIQRAKWLKILSVTFDKGTESFDRGILICGIRRVKFHDC